MSANYSEFQVTGNYTNTGELYGFSLSHMNCDARFDKTTGQSSVHSALDWDNVTLAQMNALADEHWKQRHEKVAGR